MLNREQIRVSALEAKSAKGLSWQQIANEIARSPVYAAMLVYGYGQANEAEAQGLTRVLALPEQAKKVLMQVPHRAPAQPWPPTDPFIYRFYEAIMLYGPVFKDVAHEIFGDGIMSAIDMSVDIQRVEEAGVARMAITLNGKWLTYKKF